MQQHSKSPQSRHLVFPGSMPAGLLIEDTVEDGETKFTGDDVVAEGEECEHMVFLGRFYEGEQ